jgi:hypothetical protein
MKVTFLPSDPAAWLRPMEKPRRSGAKCHAETHAYRLTIEGDANTQLQIRRTE